MQEPDDIRILAKSYVRDLRGENKAPRTIEVYSEAISRLADWLESEGLETNITDIEREHLEGFMAALLQRHSPATAHNRYRALRTFFAWAEDEDDTERSPMAKMSPALRSRTRDTSAQ